MPPAQIPFPASPTDAHLSASKPRSTRFLTFLIFRRVGWPSTHSGHKTPTTWLTIGTSVPAELIALSVRLWRFSMFHVSKNCKVFNGIELKYCNLMYHKTTILSGLFWWLYTISRPTIIACPCKSRCYISDPFPAIFFNKNNIFPVLSEVSTIALVS